MNFSDYWQRLKKSVKEIEVEDNQGNSFSLEDGLQIVTRHIIHQTSQGKKVLFIGNGGSASIASHMAIDFWKNGRMKAVSFNDPAQLTCLANDLGVEQIFSSPIEIFAEKGDILVAISSSGKSPNILNGVDAGKKRQCWILTLSGFTPSNPLRKMGDLNFYVPENSYGIVESAHAILCHYILDRIMEMNQS